MRPQDRFVFSQAAKKFRAWILVRRTNPASLQYIGKSGYTPKRIDCKAKTADFDVKGRRLAGLVADPLIHPEAFKSSKLNEATKNWNQFLAEKKIGPNGEGLKYSVQRDATSPHFGCAMFQGCYIHGDYDLYDIILADHPRGNLAAVETLHGQLHMRGPRWIPIQNFINGRIGVPVVQHGGEMQYADHSEQSIDVFGPEGQVFTILNEYSIRKWYSDVFQRQALKSKP